MRHDPTPPSLAPSAELLAEAFVRFQEAAASLQVRHAALLTRVDRLERELGSAHRRLEAVLDAMDGGVAVLAPDGTILRANRAFTATGLGRTGGVLDDARLTEPAGERLTIDAAEGPRELRATVVPVEDGEATRVLTLHDVTDIRREEEYGGRQKRLEALGRMAAEIAHEVRNPLGSIRLFASMLQDDLEGQEPLRDMALQILAATAGLESMVSNLLAFASPSKAPRRPVDLVALAADVCGLLAPACSLRGVRLHGPAAGPSCVLEAEPEGLRQVCLNLVGNALAATDPGGEIRVDVRTQASGAQLLVEDEGRGIAPEDLPRVFDPFFSRTEGGTGLGLSIVHGVVERHGGTVALLSRPGRGTIARVELPFRAAPGRGEVSHA